jgi:hypothetical protein
MEPARTITLPFDVASSFEEWLPGAVEHETKRKNATHSTSLARRRGVRDEGS